MPDCEPRSVELELLESWAQSARGTLRVLADFYEMDLEDKKISFSRGRSAAAREETEARFEDRYNAIKAARALLVDERLP